MSIESRYMSGDYLQKNPAWHQGDSAWKASHVKSILTSNAIVPHSVCEVGCGAGNVLCNLVQHYSSTKFIGYDISPQAAELWTRSLGVRPTEVELFLGDFHRLNKVRYDVLLMLDVFEHVRDPFTFLELSKQHGIKFVFHIPLDLCASSLAREMPLLKARRDVGHLHFYTKDLALETLEACGYRIIEWRYTGAFMNSPDRSVKTRLVSILRRISCAINRDWGVRMFGGETLIVLAE